LLTISKTERNRAFCAL